MPLKDSLNFTHHHHRQSSLHSLVKATTAFSPHHQHTTHWVSAPGAGGDPVSNMSSEQFHFSPTPHIQNHLQAIYDEIKGSEKALTTAQVLAFLKDSQGIEVQLSPEQDKKDWTFGEWLEILDRLEGLAGVKHKTTEQDLTKPISNYFINSSHNTYLQGNQLSGKTSTEAYKVALLRGCRCIEIDVWNGEAKDFSPRFSDLSLNFATQGPTAASATFREARENFKWMKEVAAEKIGFGHHEKSGSSHHHKVPSINTHPDPDDLKDSAIESAVITDTPMEAPPSARSSRHSSNASTKSSRFEPQVLHGWTLTPTVCFRDVCIAIRESAFKTSELPIIVSLEVHADLEQQQVMVDIMKEEWAGLLVDEVHPLCNPDERLPRLEELKHKILVKVKKGTTPLKNNLPIVPEKVNSIGSESSSLKSQNTLVPSATNASLAPRTASDDRDAGLSDSDDGRSSKTSKPKKKKATICEALSKLGIYTHSEHFDSFDAPSATSPPHIYSIAEGDILELHGNQRAKMFMHNQQFFMRAYPSGRRVDSSNPDPSIFWRKGVQMVALNWQSWDEGTMINEGMFANEAGWVLKPPGFLPDSGPVKRQTLDFSITILAGQHVPLPEGEKNDKGFHPYVKCEVHVDKHEEVDGIKMTGGKVEGTFKLSTPKAKGENPDWGKGVKLKWEGLPNVIEELSFIRIKIEDDERLGSDKLAAWTCIRLDKLQNGVRFLKLYDYKGNKGTGLLMVRIEKKLR